MSLKVIMCLAKEAQLPIYLDNNVARQERSLLARGILVSIRLSPWHALGSLTRSRTGIRRKSTDRANDSSIIDIEHLNTHTHL